MRKLLKTSINLFYQEHTSLFHFGSMKPINFTFQDGYYLDTNINKVFTTLEEKRGNIVAVEKNQGTIRNSRKSIILKSFRSESTRTTSWT